MTSFPVPSGKDDKMMNNFAHRICILLALLCMTLASQAQPWVRKAGTKSVSLGESIARDNSGNVYVTGIFSCDLYVGQDTLFNITCGDTVTPPSLIPRYDGFIIKYDNNGNEIWSRQITGNFSNTHLIFSGISVNTSGESYVTGYYKGSLDFDGTVITNTVAASDFFVAKYDASGNVLWVRNNYARQTADSIKSNSISVDLSGNCYIGGMFMDTAVFNGDADTLWADTPELFVLKLDASGNHGWVFSSRGDGSGSSAEIKDLQVDANENVFITGNYKDTLTLLGKPVRPLTGVQRVFVSKIGPDPALVWWKDGVATTSQAVTLDQSGEFLFITGNYLTSANFNGTPLTAPAGSYGTFIARYDTTGGTVDWVRKLQVAAADSAITGYGVSCDEFGAAYVAGIFGKNTSTNAVVTDGTSTLNGESSMDVFIAKYTDAGVLKWTQMLGDNLVDGAKDITVADSMNIFVTGYFSEKIIVDSMQVENSGGGVNAFTAKIDPCPYFYARAIAAGATTFCEGDSVLLQATTGTGLNYQWQLNGTDIPGATAANYYAKDSANYRVKMWHNNPFIACTKYSLAIEVTVNPLPNVTLTTDGDTIFCDGDHVTIATGVGNKYQWYESGAILTNDTSYNYMATASGVYSVVARNMFGCKDTSLTKTVTVYTYPAATITPAAKSIICQGDTVFMTANTGVNFTYQWFKNGTALTNDTLQTFKAYVSGYFTVAVSNEIGCTTTSVNDTVSVVSSPPATLSYSGSLTFCVDQPIMLYANSGIGLLYQWQRNSVDITGAQSSTYQPTLSGTYQVVVTNNFNCSNTSASAAVIVNPQPVASFTTPLPANICNGDSLLFTAGAGSGYTYKWYRNLALQSGTNATFYAKTSGSYSLIVTDANSCSDTSSAVQVTVFGVPLATVTITGATTFCVGDSVRLAANSGSNLTYQWYKDGSILPGITSLVYYAKTSGDYQVRVTNINSCSRTSSPVVSVTVYTFPTATITPLGALTFCQGVGCDLQANTGTGLAYQWKKNNVNISGATSSLYHATEAGTYTVLVSVGSSCSVISSSVTVSVNAVTKPVIATNGSNISTSFFPTYQWYKDGVAISGATLQIYNVVANGSYTVEVTNPNSCIATSDAVTVCVPVPEITVSGALLQSTSGASYQWYIEDVAINGAVAQNYLCQISGNYKVKVTDGNGCSSFSVPVLVCVPPPTITLGANNVLTASNGVTFQWYLDGAELVGEDTRITIAQQTGSYVVRVENFEGCISNSMPLDLIVNSTQSAVTSDLQVYPNPAKENITVLYAPGFSNEVSVSITDLSGSFTNGIANIQQNHNALTIELNSLPGGMYLLHVKDHDTYKVTLITILK